MTYETDIRELTVNKSLKLLRDGFKHDLASFIDSDPRVVELLQDLVGEFVEVNIPVIDEDNQMELKFMLFEKLKIVAR